MNLTLSRYLILSEARTGFKYDRIWEGIEGVRVVNSTFIGLMKAAILSLGSGEKRVYHVRYLKAGRAVIFRYRLIALLSFLGLFKILWTCHNINEHNYKSHEIPLLRRVQRLVINNAKRTIVFHCEVGEALKQVFPVEYMVACFGDMRAFVKGQTKENPIFQEKLKSWQSHREKIDVLSVSTARLNRLDVLIKNAGIVNISGVVIAPFVSVPVTSLPEGILFYNKTFVQAEVEDLLKQKKIVGYVGHVNCSVPTSVYMFASYGVPILGFNVEPVRSIIETHEIGVVIEDDSSEAFVIAWNLMRLNYLKYRENCSTFLAENNWGRSAEVHRKALVEL